MREMKNSGIPWIGDIPKEWKSQRFKYAGTFQKGKLPETSNIDGLGQPIIGASEMLGKEPRQFSEDRELPTCNCSDILILWDGANAGITASHLSGIVSSTVSRYTCSDTKCLNDYVSYLFKSAEVYFRDKVFGTTIPHMNSDYIDEYPMLLPPIVEQQAIADFLDKKCAEIDEMISLQEKIIEELKAYKQSVITEAVTKGLNPDAPMKDSGVEWIDFIPSTWRTCKVKNVISLLTDYDANGSFADIAENVKVNIGEPYAWMVRATDLANCRYGIVEGNNYCGKETFNYLKKSVVHSGDVLIAKRGEIGKVYIVPAIDCPMTLAPNTYLLILNQRINNKFFFYYLTSNIGRIQLELNNKSTAIGAIYKDDVKDICVLLPTIDIQNEISEYLDKKCSEIDSLISLKLSKIEQLKEYKKSIIYEYVTGKKEVEA